MIKQLLRKALKTDPEFAGEVFQLIGQPSLMELDPKKNYMLVIQDVLTNEQVDALVEGLKGSNIAIIHGSHAQLIEFTALT